MQYWLRQIVSWTAKKGLAPVTLLIGLGGIYNGSSALNLEMKKIHFRRWIHSVHQTLGAFYVPGIMLGI